MADGVPTNIGLIGVGTLGSSIVRGLCSEGAPEPKPKFVLGPRNAEKAAALAKELPDLVRVAASNQEVVDSVDCVLIAVLPKQVDEVMAALKFREGQKVLSLVATLKMDKLKELAAPAVEIATACPLPAVAHRLGATILTPPVPSFVAMFEVLGTCVKCGTESEYKRLQSFTALMGDFYKRQLTAQEWLEASGIAPEEASAWTGAVFATFAADSKKPGPTGLARLVAEQTPGGLNEMVWKGQAEDGSYEAYKDSLDVAFLRFSTGEVNPDMAPAAKRLRRAKAE